MDPNIRHIQEEVHVFVQSFLPDINQNTDVRLSSVEILQGITLRFRENMEWRIDQLSFEVTGGLKIFLDNCRFIATLRGQDIIIPKVMRYTNIVRYLQYCMCTRNAIYYTSGEAHFRITRIPNAEDFLYKRYFINTIRTELYAKFI